MPWSRDGAKEGEKSSKNWCTQSNSRHVPLSNIYLIFKDDKHFNSYQCIVFYLGHLRDLEVQVLGQSLNPIQQRRRAELGVLVVLLIPTISVPFIWGEHTI